MSQANSAPSTPSAKEGDPKTFPPIKVVTHKSVNQRRHSGVKTATAMATPASAETLPVMLLAAAAPQVSKDRPMTQSRSRLAQELLEQNYAILQALKDRGLQQVAGGSFDAADGEASNQMAMDGAAVKQPDEMRVSTVQKY